ncbi:MAG: response regulator transcription factor, partial [Dehalococcoidia bacterium]|nr:response regulator transcription factor [Dehalococcoidia bacterium]
MSAARVLLVDDQLLFRKGLRALLSSEEDFEVVAEAGDGQEAVDKVRVYNPDIVLMDIHMPGMDGIQATRLIKSERPEVKVVILTVSDEEDDLFEAIKVGAEGYLLKNLRPEELAQMLRGVMSNEAPVSPAVASKLLGEFRRRPRRDEEPSPGQVLTAREQEILQLVAEGLSNAEIAARLYVVEGTVKNHLHNILEKLHLQNRVQAAAYAIREGYVMKKDE